MDTWSFLCRTDSSQVSWAEIFHRTRAEHFVSCVLGVQGSTKCCGATSCFLAKTKLCALAHFKASSTFHNIRFSTFLRHSFLIFKKFGISERLNSSLLNESGTHLAREAFESWQIGRVRACVLLVLSKKVPSAFSYCRHLHKTYDFSHAILESYES